MEFLKPYYIFLFPAFIGIFVQAIKFVIYSLKNGWKLQYAFTHGHMPSAHTAFVVSLVTSVGYYAGVNSGAFAVAVALAIIVIDDAARLRMYLGDQGRYLNMLVHQLHINEKQFPRLKERVGHRVSEIIIGGFLGFALTLILVKLLE